MVKIKKSTIYIIPAAVIVGLIAVFMLFPPSYEPPERDLRDEVQFMLFEKIGWYLFDDSTRWMITYGAQNGLTINHFNPLDRGYLTPKQASLWEWKERNKPLVHEITFQKDSLSNITGFAWDDQNGKNHTASKINEYGYGLSQVELYNHDMKIVATLMKPFTQGPHPAVVLIHGSGVSDRDNLWYLYIADNLARNGIAVLFPDKRGCGQSEGKWHVAGFNDFTNDAIAGIEYLASLENINSHKIGLLGISQGGWIAPLAADKSDDIDFVINLSGSMTTPNKQIAHEVRADVNNAGLPEFLASIMAPIFTERAKNKRKIWWKKNGGFEVIKYWKSIAVPALIVYGRKDENDNVPVNTSESLLKQHGSDKTTLIIYEDSGHALQDPKSGTNLPRKDLLELMITWIKSI